MTKKLDVEVLNEVINKTIQAIESGKKEIFEISESARKECDDIENELIELKKKAAKIIEEVDLLERLEKSSRKKLLIVSRNFSQFDEEDIKRAYEDANNLQLSLSLKRQEEKLLISRRSNLEMKLKRYKAVVEKAESLTSKVGVVLGYLSGNLKGVFEQLEDIQQRQFMGIKIIKAQEEERQRVSKEIHDGPAQTMVNVVLKAELCDRLLDIDKEKAKKELQLLKGIVRDSLKDIRKIIYDLMPMSLDDLGLIPTIQRLVLNFKNDTKTDVDFIVNEKNEIKESIIQLTIFRIIQEALNNIKKHAEANRVLIRLDIGIQKIYLKIIDDGIGFNVNEKVNSTDDKNGFGLYSIRERVDLLNGNIDIESENRKGTIINVSIPLCEEEE
ncbi:sensor histidine kinase [Paramaledivibacter caminithermalis]|jgi:two-component system sensor histidine kinase DegS|uniref:histidine kinase n=1 Tax=Paramaledivibacter caminithermalis (strain DSM 15212 / CIP 107654 / DViRD3) TaxID=1121301 RepID=A0A1M6MCM0_PARC5|nr:sensor histidine kinase [Paramaledivibacter caminithermalis]SHJ81147.1 two-component system, NarL family, sensor histidine kinase DegS [Paramaledivibacter caminithermalis DSM 15212]